MPASIQAVSSPRPPRRTSARAVGVAQQVVAHAAQEDVLARAADQLVVAVAAVERVLRGRVLARRRVRGRAPRAGRCRPGPAARRCRCRRPGRRRRGRRSGGRRRRRRSSVTGVSRASPVPWPPWALSTSLPSPPSRIQRAPSPNTWTSTSLSLSTSRPFEPTVRRSSRASRRPPGRSREREGHVELDRRDAAGIRRVAGSERPAGRKDRDVAVGDDLDAVGVVDVATTSAVPSRQARWPTESISWISPSCWQHRRGLRAGRDVQRVGVRVEAAGRGVRGRRREEPAVATRTTDARAEAIQGKSPRRVANKTENLVDFLMKSPTPRSARPHCRDVSESVYADFSRTEVRVLRGDRNRLLGAETSRRAGPRSGARRAPGGHRDGIWSSESAGSAAARPVGTGPQAIQEEAEEAAPELGLDVPGAVDDRPDHQLQHGHVLTCRSGAACPAPGPGRPAGPRAARSCRRVAATWSRPCGPPSTISLSPRSVACRLSVPSRKPISPSQPSSSSSACIGERADVGEARLEERLDQLLLVGEAPVDRPDADARVVGDVVQGDLEAALREQVAGRREDPQAVALGVLPERPGAHEGRSRVARSGGHVSAFPLGSAQKLRSTPPLSAPLSAKGPLRCPRPRTPGAG